MAILFLQILIVFFVAFLLLLFLRQLFFYGFTPFTPTRPEAIKKILGNIEFKKGATVYALGFGRSGFLKGVLEQFPDMNLKLFGAEDKFLYYFPAKFQALLKGRKIKVKFCDFYKLDVSKADIIYLYLNTKILRDIYKKLIVDTKDGAQVVSTGFMLPYLEPVKVVEISPRKRWFYFLSKRNKEILTPKEREQKRDNKVYFYEL